MSDSTPRHGEAICQPFSAIGVRPASGSPGARRFASGIRLLDEFLQGGLPLGALTEWGAPLGLGGREALMPWVARATTGGIPDPGSGVSLAGALPSWCLWVLGQPQLTAYPPAWAARGVDLARLRFATAGAPLTDLRPVFLEPTFRMIVLDTPRQLSDEDCAFIAQRARQYQQIVVIIRDSRIGDDRGNVWARLRINTAREAETGRLRLSVVRGLSPRQLILDDEALSPDPQCLWSAHEHRSASSVISRPESDPLEADTP